MEACSQYDKTDGVDGRKRERRRYPGGPVGPLHPSGSVIMLAAAQPGQKLHKTEFEMPQITSRRELERFHEQLSKHLSAVG